jgi:hypothetical protein
MLNAHWHDDIPIIGTFGQGNEHAAVGIAERAVDAFAVDVVENV